MISPTLQQQAEAFRRPSSLAAIAACPGRPTMEAAIEAHRMAERRLRGSFAPAGAA